MSTLTANDLKTEPTYRELKPKFHTQRVVI
jgi:hypothetical protein